MSDRGGRSALWKGASADRRNLLRVLGGTAGIASLAGCPALGESYEFTADTVGIDESTRSEEGYVEEQRETLTAERSESVGGAEAEITINSQLTVYDSEQDSEPIDENALWEAESGLSAWTGNEPGRGIDAAELTDGSLSARSDAMPVESVPAAAAQVWTSGATNGTAAAADLLVALPASDLDAPNSTFEGRELYAYDAGEFFPRGVALAFEDSVRFSGGGYD